MISLVGLVLGAFFGGWTAKRRGGDRADMAQYAAVFGLIFALLAIVIWLIIGRTTGF